jgi:hemerythrin
MSTYVRWQQYYSVGEDSLDAQHKQILSIINDLYNAMDAGKEADVLKGLMDRLAQYTLSHFQHEERLMTEFGYPDLVNHKAEHDKMRRRTRDLSAHLDLVTARDLLRILKEWWTGHIQAEDLCYIPFLRTAARRQQLAGAPAQAVGPIDGLGQATPQQQTAN